ncbi:MAG: NmrA family NAD(P)-binding protein [Deltaproteobacteria bacterium]|nr:NmrA family NAD(P)-binding protein [Deltaproteobacteria bacterium]
MSRTVLVLTATGTTGAATVKALLAQGAVVRAGTRDPSKASFAAGVQAVAWSYDDRATWNAALQGVDALYLAMPPFRADEAEVGTAILAAAKAAGIKRIVKLSAIGVEANPASPHRQVELAIEASGLDWVHLRPSFFMENFIEFYGGPIKAEGALYVPAGKGKTGFVAAADIGAMAAAALLGNATGEAWVITGPEALDHDDVAALIGDATGKPVKYHDIPAQVFADALRSFGSSEVGVATMSALYEYVRNGWTGALTGEVERVLGRPPTPFADWARAHAAAW